MKTYKVSELDGDKLDLAAAKAIGLTAEMALDFGLGCPDWLTAFHPSRVWSHGGPIIERERIALVWMVDGWHAYLPDHNSSYTGAGYIDVADWQADGTGQTPMIAAMRACVASKFGDTIELEV